MLLPNWRYTITTQIVQAVIECGRDENLQQGAAHQLAMTTHYRACLRKILQRDFLKRRSSRCQSINKLTVQEYSKAHGVRTLTKSQHKSVG
jgi:hypothetical protein